VRKTFLDLNLTGGCPEKFFVRKHFLPSLHVTHFDFTTLIGLLSPRNFRRQKAIAADNAAED
jgi:hypothetical protein